MQNIAIIDAGPLIALFDASDKYHSLTTNFLKNYKGKLLTTIPVITEATHLLSFDLQAQKNLLKWIEIGGLKLFDIQMTHIQKIIELMDKYSDRPMVFADASLVIISEELNINKIISIDSDFTIYRFKRNRHFKNLLK
jgi:predicted nucleic acid-binding protein